MHSRETCGIFRAGKDFWKLFLFALRKIGIFLEEDSGDGFFAILEISSYLHSCVAILHFIIIFSKLVYCIIVYSII